ncbi:unnamed protein product [Gongylonema pulchrum]|uniref:Phosphatidylinositol-3-phosphatase SAC1 n=1 Tax=Gongylonema pulchrum TaxID=637853 RepID=A0A183DR32_9BILA|nr:unnamed protein product [Gongylonema pulchrum]
MSHRFAFRIAHRNASMEPYSVIVESQRTKKVLLFQSAAIATIYDAHLLAVTDDESVGELRGSRIYRIWEVLRLLSSGSFYYATSSGSEQCMDLTVAFQKSVLDSNAEDSCFFCANGPSVIVPRLPPARAKASLVVPTIENLPVLNLCISGHISELFVAVIFRIVTLGSSEVSFLQIRGSVPLFWEQPGINVGSHKVKLRAFEASAPAFSRHFRLLKESYGDVTAVNLLGSKEGETLLSKAYEAHYKNSHCAVDYIAFDYHEEKRNCLKLIDRLKATILKCMFFCRRNGSLICTQNGVIRVNCLDCLDRTNAVQTLIGFQVARFHFGIFRIVPLILQSYEVLTSQLESLQVDRKYFSRFEEHLKDIWQRNGDACSVKDARRTLVRTIQNNFLDSSKQEAFDFLLHGASIYDCFFRQVACMLPRDIIQSPHTGDVIEEQR